MARTPLRMQDKAFFELERMIVNGELEPGQWVSESDLVEMSGYTRASVRAAVQRLSDVRLIQIVPRRGAQICPIDYTQQLRSLELRRVVEKLIAKSAAKRATPEQRERFMQIAKDLITDVNKKNQEQLTDLDSQAFSLSLEAADNDFASRALSSVKGLSRRFWVLHQERYGDIEKIGAAHALVLSAIAEGNQDEAEAAVDKLIDYVESFTLEAIGYSKADKKIA